MSLCVKSKLAEQAVLLHGSHGLVALLLILLIDTPAGQEKILPAV